MKKLVLVFVVLALAVLSLAFAACGEKEVPAGAIAAVGDGVVTQEQFDAIMEQAKAQYASSEGAPAFPEEGTAQYSQFKASIVAYLVQNELIAQNAVELDVEVTDKELTDRVAEVQQSVGGEKKLAKMLKQQGVTMEQVKDQLEASMLQDKVKEKVYADVKISDAQIKEYFEDPANEAQFKQAASRDVRHVLVKTQAEAEKVRALLAADNSDANWKTVAKQYSEDPGSKDSGGALGAVQKGSTVPQFEKAAWKLDVNEVSLPVKTQFGWHVLEVTKVTPKTTQTLDEAKESIRQMLLYQKQATAWQDWLEQAEKDAEIVYGAGFNPDALTASATPAPSATAEQ